LKYFMVLCELVSDPIVNVRLELSNTLAKVYTQYKDEFKILSVIEKL